MILAQNWALIGPMANEEKEFYPFIIEGVKILNRLKSAKGCLILDKVQ
jgi:hypothetical protein